MNSNRFLNIAKRTVLQFIKSELYPSTRLSLNEIYVITMFGNRVLLGTELLDLIYYEVSLDEDAHQVKMRVFDLMEDNTYPIDYIESTF